MGNPLDNLQGNVPFRPIPGGPMPADIKAIPADALAMSGMTVEGRPGVAFQFRSGETTLPTIVLLDPTYELVELTRGCVEAALAQDGYRRPEDEAEGEQVASALRGGPAVRARLVTCSGCGRRLFGERVEVGLCTVCEDQDEGAQG